MADMSAFLLAMLAVGGGTVLAAQSGAPPARVERAEQAMAFRAASAAGHTSGTARRTVIQRDEDGLFYVDAMVNGTRIHFLIDTGANMVVLSPQDAARAGVASGRAIGSLNTAAGSMSSAMTQINRIAVAGHEFHDVDATIPSAGLRVSLLGQNVLTELGEMRIGRSILTVG